MDFMKNYKPLSDKDVARVATGIYFGDVCGTWQAVHYAVERVGLMLGQARERGVSTGTRERRAELLSAARDVYVEHIFPDRFNVYRAAIDERKGEFFGWIDNATFDDRLLMKFQFDGGVFISQNDLRRCDAYMRKRFGSGISYPTEKIQEILG
jgi:hypothetical protein